MYVTYAGCILTIVNNVKLEPEVSIAERLSQKLVSLKQCLIISEKTRGIFKTPVAILKATAIEEFRLVSKFRFAMQPN